jgi:uncharacterized damage-inducible protein DinB
MISSVQAFRKYFDGVRRRTMNYIETIPPDEIDWSPGPGRFSCGDLVRHLAATEQMYVGVVLEGNWQYHGHAPTDATRTLDDAVAQLKQIHEGAMEKLMTLPDVELTEPRPGPVPNTRPIKAWRWLMLMAEHEIHHRSELASYLTQMGHQPPQIFGLTFEELQSLAGDQ